MEEEQKVTAGLEGLVIARAPGYFVVRTDDGATRLCVLRGKLRRARTMQTARSRLPQRPSHPSSRSPSLPLPAAPTVITTVAVGDRVRLTPDGMAGGAIDAVLPRFNKLSRMAIDSTAEQILLANLDMAILVFAVAEPSPHFGLLDRYLVVTEDADIDTLICFTKVDLGINEKVAEMIALYERLGYPIVKTSIINDEGLDVLRGYIAQRVTLLTGPSGVGKSSLLNRIEPEAAQRVGEISASTGKGRHTTTGVRLFPLQAGGWLADSAGIREFAPWGVPNERLAETFVEFRPYLGQCAYDDCTHDECAEGCALRAAVDKGAIALSRYESYLRLRDDG